MISKCRPVDTGRSVGGRRRQYSVRPGLAKWVGRASAPVLALAASMLTLTPANAQLPGPQAAPGEASPLQPGEAFVTRFSGSRMSGNEDEGVRRVIDVNGTVGSIIDVRAPGQAPMGQHWTDEPQRARVTAGQVGQVFGVALDDAEPPNIYVTATAAFGLHLNPGTSEWMAGMWGRGGGPGTVYKLDRDNGYQPRVFANIALNGRQNSGAALGNIAFDRFNRQLLVSDMETGMIHRLRLSDGADLGFFDHGTQGRASFLDVASGETRSLPA